MTILNKMMSQASTQRMPTLFVGHGYPMNALELNSYTEQMRHLGASLPRPQGILVISAHWITNGTFVTSADKPRQIYDFSGFPQELYQIKYEPPGSKEIPALVKNHQPLIHESSDWGLDHGAWSILNHLFPQQDIPVHQLSLNQNLQPQDILKLTKELRALRRKGILILGSGNLVHNLRRISWDPDAPASSWAQEFETKSLEILSQPQKSHEEMTQAIISLPEFEISHPTPEHFIPLIYNLGLLEEDETLQKVYAGIQNGSISMATMMSQGQG